jgi:predicted acylesterase/phospholipase RssA
MRGLNRKTFMVLGAAVSAVGDPRSVLAQSTAPAGPIPKAATVPTIPGAPRNALAQALVLSGGGALGAYEAGVVESLAAAAGVHEGQPLRPYGVVCGTSIGALNAYLVATGQYARLRSLWSDVASQQVIRLKPEFAKITNPSSGVFNRVDEEYELVHGLQHNVTGIFDGDHLRSWMLSYFDFSRPVLTPMVWAVTNLTLERPEYFYLAPGGATSSERAVAIASIQLALGTDVPVREASPDLLVDQLRASAAFPVAFDPVRLPAPGGGTNEYVDGGVTANTPLRVASALALRTDTVLLNPSLAAAQIQNAVQVASSAFDTMQRSLMDSAVRSAYFESVALRALRALPPTYTASVAEATGVSIAALEVLRNTLYETDLYVLRPATTLPVSLFGFQDGAALAATYAMGKADAMAGFRRFDPTR